MKTYKSGQSINEYVLVIVLVALAGIGMQAYIKRGVQGIVKSSADTLAGEEGDVVEYSGHKKSNLARYKDGKLQWNPIAITYESRLSGGFFVAEKTGNKVQYVHYPDASDLKNKIIIAGQDWASGDFTSYDGEGYVDAVYDKSGNLIKNFTPEEAKNNYSKYEVVLLSSAGNKPIVQDGVIEQGLIEFNYKNAASPLTVETPVPKKITVETHSKYSGPKSLPEAAWHPAMTGFQTRMEEDGIRGFIQAEIRGSKVYYYTFTTDPKNRTLIGAEDTRTHDFTEFDPDGFPLATVDSSLKTLREYNGYVADPKTKEITGVIEAGCVGDNCRVYGQYEIVNISPALPSAGPAITGKTMRTKTIDEDKTHVTGAWDSTYKLGADIYKPKSDKAPKK